MKYTNGPVNFWIYHVTLTEREGKKATERTLEKYDTGLCCAREGNIAGRLES